MKVLLSIPVMVAAWLLAGQAQALAAPAARHELGYGTTNFRLETTSRDVYTLTPSLHAVGPHGLHHHVDLREPSFVLRHDQPGLRVIAAPVIAWLCRHMRAGPILTLMYVCPQDYADDRPDPDCSITGKWVRYTTTKGTPPDPGYGLDDPRYVRLERHLGIPANEQLQMIYVEQPPVPSRNR